MGATAVVFGGYGTFGQLVSKGLASLGVTVIIAGRNLAQAEALAHQLGRPHQGVVADITVPASCRVILKEGIVAVNCTGPFTLLDHTLLDLCLEIGCHYVDIAEERAYAAMVRSYGARFYQQGCAAVYGCSSLPGISGALGLIAAANTIARPDSARVTLFIGNNNPKGQAAIRTAVAQLGKPIKAPQGELKGFRDGEIVALPEPFGSRRVFNFESPEYDLFPQLLGVRAVLVKVGFELKSATLTFALLAALSSNYGEMTAAVLAKLGDLGRGLGRSGGVVMTELFYQDGTISRAALFCDQQAQGMVALPCVFAAEMLCKGDTRLRGALTAYELLGSQELIDRIVAAGFRLMATRV
ncbi:MAG: saccharopine dehydrogenase NADP-binding domain-containing protein [Acidobacteriota bacterium]